MGKSNQTVFKIPKLEDFKTKKNKFTFYSYVASGAVNNSIISSRCGSHIKSQNASKKFVFIPIEEGEEQRVRDWVDFITKAGYDCKVSDEKRNVNDLPHSIKHYCIVELDFTNNNMPNAKALCVLTLLRYLYVKEFSYLADIAMGLKEMYPQFNEYQCILLSHIVLTKKSGYDGYYGFLPNKLVGRRATNILGVPYLTKNPSYSQCSNIFNAVEYITRNPNLPSSYLYSSYNIEKKVYEYARTTKEIFEMYLRNTSNSQ